MNSTHDFGGRRPNAPIFVTLNWLHCARLGCYHGLVTSWLYSPGYGTHAHHAHHARHKRTHYSLEYLHDPAAQLTAMHALTTSMPLGH